MAFEQVFKNIDDILHKDAGCTSELDYTEQSSWLLFLKYLDALEQDKAVEAKLDGKKYAYILESAFRWETWAAPKGKDGKLDHNTALTGDDLRNFVNGKLFPYLAGFKQRASGPNTIEYKIGEVFGEIKNKIQSGYNLRDVIERVDELRFRSQSEKHELSHLYEAKIKNMGNAGRNGGEYYTPRPLIRAMIKVLDPKIGERIYDGACGSAGFLCEAFDYLLPKAKKADDLKTLQTRTFYGKEKKSLAYVIGIMNMILHGIEAPNVIHANTLADNISDFQDRDRYDVILANPPFGGKERKEVQQNFPIKSAETAYLFLQHFIKTLRAGGRAAIVIKDTFLSNTDSASVSLRRLLLKNCNLHTVLDCPRGTFLGAGVKTVVLFFEKGAHTRKIWFYQLHPGRNMGKTNPLNDEDLTEFVELQKTLGSSTRSWSVDVTDIDTETFDLSVKNPNGNDSVPQTTLADLLSEVLQSEICSIELPPLTTSVAWEEKSLGEVMTLEYGKPLAPADRSAEGAYPAYGANGEKDRTDKYYCDKPTIIIGRKGSAGELTLTEGKFWPLDVAYFVEFDREEHDLRFLHYLLSTLGLPKLAKGVKPGINRNEVYALKVRIPPLKEQQRVVSLLDAAFDDISAARVDAERRLLALGALEAMLLRHALSGHFPANS